MDYSDLSGIIELVVYYIDRMISCMPLHWFEISFFEVALIREFEYDECGCPSEQMGEVDSCLQTSC